jgi:hypothetical protein
MADIDKAALRNRVLEHLSIIAAGQTPATADQTLVEEAIDAAWSRLGKLGLIPFLEDEIPAWAQMQMCDVVAYDVAPKYGISGSRLGELSARATRAEFDLNRQVSGRKHKRTPRRMYF